MSKSIKLTDMSGRDLYISGYISLLQKSDHTEIRVFDGGYAAVKETAEVIVEKMEKFEAQLLRDEFAMAALGGILSSQGIRDIKYIGELSYEIADAMLKERSK